MTDLVIPTKGKSPSTAGCHAGAFRSIENEYRFDPDFVPGTEKLDRLTNIASRNILRGQFV